MSRHVLWTEEEVIERMTSEFQAAMSGLENLEWKIRDALDDLDAISAP